MKRKDIFCMSLILLLIYLLFFKNNVEYFSIVGSIDRRESTPEELLQVVPDAHSGSR